MMWYHNFVEVSICSGIQYGSMISILILYFISGLGQGPENMVLSSRMTSASGELKLNYFCFFCQCLILYIIETIILIFLLANNVVLNL